MKKTYKFGYLFMMFLALFLIQLSFEKTMYAQGNDQYQSVTGRITDTEGEPIIGAGVLIKEKVKSGTVTDVDGKYTISVVKGQTLVFSCIGYETQTVVFKGKSVVNVQLQDDFEKLTETVVIGYGSVKKRDLTGSVSSLKSSDLLSTNPASVNQGLQGKLAGVNVAQSDGAPGAGVSIQIRGANSFTTSTEPLYIVDGIPFITGEAPSTDYGTKQTNNPLSSIAPQDIESIEVLKDASATAIYGSRAANGVILITTKSGRTGKAKVDFSANFSVSKPVKTIDVLDAATYAEYRNEVTRNGYKYDGKDYVDDTNLPYPIPGRWVQNTIKNPETGEIEVINRSYSPSPDDFRNGYYRKEGDQEKFYGVNWQDQIFHTALSQEYNLTVSG